MQNDLLKMLSSIPRQYMAQEDTPMGKQRLIVLFIFTTSIIATILVNLFGIGGPQALLNLAINAAYLVATVFIFMAQFFGQIKVRTALNILMSISQTSTIIEMLHCATAPTTYNLMLIVGNMLLLYVNVMLALAAYLQYATQILNLSSIVAYGVCAYMTGNDDLLNFFFIFLMVFLFIAFLSYLLIRNNERMNAENQYLKQEVTGAYHFLGTDSEQLHAYQQLTEKELSAGEVKKVMQKLSELERQNLINNLSAALRKETINEANVARAFPQLSASEQAICLFVLMKKKQSEIAKLLKKSETNISSQRANIRKKLGLQPSDNLYSVLMQRISAVVNE